MTIRVFIPVNAAEFPTIERYTVEGDCVFMFFRDGDRKPMKWCTVADPIFRMVKEGKLVEVSCAGCGACCLYIGSPPFVSQEEYDLLPDSLRKPLDQWVENLTAESSEGVCLWFDAENKRCKNYEHRPSVCREFDVGAEDCRRVREIYGATVNGKPAPK